MSYTDLSLHSGNVGPLVRRVSMVNDIIMAKFLVQSFTKIFSGTFTLNSILRQSKYHSILIKLLQCRIKLWWWMNLWAPSLFEHLSINSSVIQIIYNIMLHMVCSVSVHVHKQKVNQGGFERRWKMFWKIPLKWRIQSSKHVYNGTMSCKQCQTLPLRFLKNPWYSSSFSTQKYKLI